MKSLFLIGLSFLVWVSVSASADSQAQQKAYKQASQTFLCSCQFDVQKMQLTDNRCFSNNLVSSPFAEKVSWTKLIPEAEFTHDLQCWHEPESFTECTKSGTGKPLSPQQCCQTVSETYRLREENLHNWVPIITKLNEQRKTFNFAQVYQDVSPFSHCKLKLNPQAKRLEPNDDIKGDIARIYFYFESLGYIRLSRRSRPLMEIWDMKDPVTESECQLQDKKAALSGQKNPYVANRCR